MGLRELAAVVCVLGAAGCSTSNKTPVTTPAAATASTPPAGGEASIAYLKQAALTTVVQSTQVTITVTGPSSQPIATGTGVVDFHRRLGLLDLTIQDLGPVRVVLAGDYLYLNPERFRPLLGTRPWFKISYTQLGSLGKVYGLGTLCSTSAVDPTQGVGWLAGATGAVTKGGVRQIRDAATTEYDVTIDPSAAGAAAPAGSNMARVAALLGNTTFPIALWIDPQGRVRLVDYTIALPESPAAADAGSSRPVSMGVEYFGFGAAVDAVEPDPTQVRDFSALATYLGASGSTAA